jgi:hypothetical protein
MSSTVAQLIEHSSRPNPEEDADPLMLLYRTLDVHTPDIARVVLSIHDARMLAKHMDDRLSPYLLEDTHGYDYAISSLLSVHGKGLKYLTTQTQAYHLIDNSSGKTGTQTMKELFTGEPRNQNEPGIRYE